MRLFNTLTVSSAAIALMAATAVPGYAQEITSSIRGAVTDADGAPIAGATVRITDTRTNSTRTFTTNARGEVLAGGLTVGGPYIVTVTAEGFRGEQVEGIFTTLNADTRLSVNLDAVGGDITEDTIVVQASRDEIGTIAIGPSSSFNLETIESFPSLERDFRDIIRIDPRVSIDRSNDEVDRVSCLGANDRFNNVTLDGVRIGDPFGLNGTGFAGRNVSPVPLDSIREIAVEFAPFDVTYGQFTGCGINVITKGGTNEFSGSFFSVFNSDEFRGSTLEGDDITNDNFEEYNWGASLGGPIIEDKLFFFVAYEEERRSATPFDEGPIGGGFATELPFLTSEVAEEIAQITQDVYGIDNGGVARSLEERTRRILTRWDWIIDENHRAEFTYLRIRERNQEEEFINSTNFQYLNTFEEEGTESEFYSARLFSQWTENLSTDFRLSRFDYQDNQGPIGGGEAQSNSIPILQVGVQNPDNGRIGIVQASGPGIFRSANQLDVQTDQIRISADYNWGRHTFRFGYEWEQREVFNLFIVNATGTINFANIEDFRNGVVSQGFDTSPNADQVFAGDAAGFYGLGSFTGDPFDAAANYKFAINTLYFQDTIQATQNLELVLGVRYDFYRGDRPRTNDNFINRYGFPNNLSFDDLDIVLPRFGFTYDVPYDTFGRTQVRGGVGVFAGGDPTVWISNSFQNFGGAIGFGSSLGDGCQDSDFQAIDDNGNFKGLPNCVTDQQIEQANQVLSDTQSTDLDFEVPSVIRANIGFSHLTDFDGYAGGFFDNWSVNMDVIYSRFRNPADFVDLSFAVNPDQGLGGFTIDGRPIYEAVDPTLDGCNAEFRGPRKGFDNVTSECFGSRDDEIQLTNGEDFDTLSFSVAFAKDFDYRTPFVQAPGTLSVNTGYAFSDVESNRDNTSAQSTSNFNATSVFDYLNPEVGTSRFETTHNAVFTASFRTEFWENFPTTVAFFFQARSGRPYDYTFDGGFFSGFEAGSDNALLYVPAGLTDPNISPLSDPAALEALDRYISEEQCLDDNRGGTYERNSCRNDWFLDLDMRIQQEFPGFLNGHRTVLFVDFDNLPNMFSDEANILRRFNTSQVDLVDVGVDDQGRYIISGFNPDDSVNRVTSASVWRVQFGLRYSF